MEPVNEQTGLPETAATALVAPTAGAGGAAVSSMPLEKVMDQFETPLLRYVAQVLGRQYDEAQDVVQDVFIRFHRHVEQEGAASIGNLRCWLYRVAYNLAMDYGRRRGRRQRLEEKVMNDPVLGEVVGVQSPPPGKALAQQEMRELALREVQALPEEQRQVLLLKMLEGLTLREIGDITGLKIGTVNYRLTQALETVAARLKGAGAL